MEARASRKHQLEWETNLMRSRVMTNPLVMEKIAQLLPASTLIQLRPICKMWNQDFIPHVLKKQRPILLTSAAYKACSDSGTDSTLMALEAYTRELLLLSSVSANHGCKLKSLKVDYMTNDMLECLFDLSRDGLCLNSLQCVIDADYSNDWNIEEDEPVNMVPLLRAFLMTQSAYLKRLHISIYYTNVDEEFHGAEPRPTVPVLIPRMERLQFLLLGRNDTRPQIIFQGATLRDTFPKLERFVHHSCNYANDIVGELGGMDNLNSDLQFVPQNGIKL